MNKHCKGCGSHHNAGHKKGSPLAKKYNDWCCQIGQTASSAIGHCKLHSLRAVKASDQSK